MIINKSIILLSQIKQKKLKKVIVSVINDLSTDQRVDKVCTTLVSCGYDVLLVGRQKKDSATLLPRNYLMERMHLLFEKEIFFYAEYNFRLFFLLLFRKVDLLVSNDLDTLLPNFLVSKLKKIPLIYDSHEYFTGVPELEHNNFARSFWSKLEKFILPKLSHLFTVNNSIAELYKQQYNVDFKVVRNIPRKREITTFKTKEELGLPLDKKILIYQGAGINIDRGVEELIRSMQFINSTILLIIGSGDIIDVLKKNVVDLKLSEKVIFINKLPYEELISYTSNADLGLTLDKDTNINYRFSLPNKIFDYIHAGIPVLTSNLVEVKKIVDDYRVGEIAYSHEPQLLAVKINSMLENTDMLMQYRANASKAAQSLCWETEAMEFINVYLKYVG